MVLMMEIELITTKKKLSKSIVQQMPFANLEDLAMVELYPERVLGYIIDKNEKFAIIKGVNDWVRLVISYPWKAATHTPLECVNKNRFLRFGDEEMRDLFLKRFAIVHAIATTHIYL